jgi:hypothetical protein
MIATKLDEFDEEFACGAIGSATQDMARGQGSRVALVRGRRGRGFLEVAEPADALKLQSHRQDRSIAGGVTITNAGSSMGRVSARSSEPSARTGCGTRLRTGPQPGG